VVGLGLRLAPITSSGTRAVESAKTTELRQVADVFTPGGEQPGAGWGSTRKTREGIAMSDIDDVLERLVTDAGFRAALADDSATALAGYSLEEDDLEVLAASLDDGGVSEHRVEQRTSKSALLGLIGPFTGGGGVVEYQGHVDSVESQDQWSTAVGSRDDSSGTPGDAVAGSQPEPALKADGEPTLNRPDVDHAPLEEPDGRSVSPRDAIFPDEEMTSRTGDALGQEPGGPPAEGGDGGGVPGAVDEPREGAAEPQGATTVPAFKASSSLRDYQGREAGSDNVESITVEDLAVDEEKGTAAEELGAPHGADEAEDPPIVLSRPASPPDAVEADELGVSEVTILGGTQAVSDDGPEGAEDLKTPDAQAEPTTE
jgi:hypothetical protein